MRFFYATGPGGPGRSDGPNGSQEYVDSSSNGNGNGEDKRGFFSKYKWRIFICVGIVWLIGKCQDDDTPVPQDTQTQTKFEREATQRAQHAEELKREQEQERQQNKQEFSFTVQEFVKRYNQATEYMPEGVRPERVLVGKRRELYDGGVEYTLASNGGPNSFTVTTNKNRNAVRSVYLSIFIADQNKNTLSVMGDLFVRFTTTIMAVENPHMPSAQRGQRLKEIGLFKAIDEKRAILTRKNNVDYKIDIVEVFGSVTLSINPSTP